MRLTKWMQGVASLIALAASAFLLCTAILKLGNLGAFRHTLESHALIPAQWTPIAAWTFPVLEFTIAVGVVWMLQSPSRLAPALLLLGGFFAFLAAYAMLLHLMPPPKPAKCGCGFSVGVVRDWWVIAVRSGLCAFVLSGLALVPRVGSRSTGNAEAEQRGTPHARRQKSSGRIPDLPEEADQ